MIEMTDPDGMSKNISRNNTWGVKKHFPIRIWANRSANQDEASTKPSNGVLQEAEGIKNYNPCVCKDKLF